MVVNNDTSAVLHRGYDKAMGEKERERNPLHSKRHMETIKWERHMIWDGGEKSNVPDLP